MYTLGQKYQTYIDDELVIFRLINVKNENKFTFIDKDNKKVSMNKEELDKCVKLEPDAIMNIMNTTSTEGTKDVYVCIHRFEAMKQGKQTPDMIIRQDTYSSSKNTFNFMSDIYVGDCLTYLSCQSEEELQSLLEYESIDYTLSVILYVDDKLEDVLKCIPNNKMNKFNQQLKYIHNEFEKANKENHIKMKILGYCDTFKELLETNSFMFYYRSIFNIAQIDFPIDLGNNVTEDNVVELNSKQIKRIEDMLRSYITDVICIKYDKDIDVSKLVGSTHMMVSDEKEDIYLIKYIVKGQYPVDDDIAKGMNVK